MEERKQFPDRPEPSRRGHFGFRHKNFLRPSDSSKLSRQQSHHIPRYSDRETDRLSNPLVSTGPTSGSPSHGSNSHSHSAKQPSEQILTVHRHATGDSSRLTRRNSHYEPPSGHDNGARLSRKPSRRQITFDDQKSDDRRHSQIAEQMSISSPSSHITPLQSSKTQKLTDKERRERKRRQNTESARRTREKRRVEMERLEMAYDANEMRIKELELMADQLSRELRRHNTISGVSRSGNSQTNDKDERPKWFGMPF